MTSSSRDRLGPALVLGAGAWGTALAIVLAGNGVPTLLWGRSRERQRRLAEERRNRDYLPDAAFPPALEPIEDWSALPSEALPVVAAVPGRALRSALERLRETVSPESPLCLCCKGVDPETRQFGHEIAEACGWRGPLTVLSGPSFAAEVAAAVPTAVIVAARHPEHARIFLDLFHNDRFRVYLHGDVLGVEIGATVKNVAAIAAGVANGLGLGANARAALVTRALAETVRLGRALGARDETFMGLSGLGDLVLSCTDDQSRNLRFGRALGQGMPVAQAAANAGPTVEGMHSAGVIDELARRHEVDMPIVEQVVRLLQGRTSPREAMAALLQRPPRNEFR